MKARTTWRLSAMMALIYAVQGSFWSLLAIHLTDLGIDGFGRGWIFATLAIASTAVPMGAGQLVDRVMAAQHVLALIYALGTGLLVVLASGWVNSAGGLFAVFMVYWAVTAPAYSLANSLAMRNLDDPAPVTSAGCGRGGRSAGCWPAGSVAAVMMATGSTRAGQGAFEALWVAAAFSASTSMYCLTLLARTPPLAVGPTGARGTWERGGVPNWSTAHRRRDLGCWSRHSSSTCTMPVVYQA